MPKCSENKIFNPKTKRCVKRDGAVGKKVLAENNNKAPEVKCDKDQIFNHKTERCVKRHGAAGESTTR